MHLSYLCSSGPSHVAVSTLTNQYFRRLLVSMLLTGFDGTVLLTYRTVCVRSRPADAMADVCIPHPRDRIAALARSHIWYTTFRTRRRRPAFPNHNPNPEERRFP